MNIYFALYDASYNTGSGHYWTWKSDIIPMNVLEQVYYDVQKLNPPDIIALRENKTCGGFILLKDWLVVYRYYNGGRDSRNRPGRVVILTAWIPRKGLYDEAILDIYQWGLFSELAKSIPPCPMPKPELDVVCNSKRLKLGNGKPLWLSLQNNLEFEFPGQTKLKDVIQAFLELPSEAENFHLSIQNSTQFKIQKIIKKEKFVQKNDTLPKSTSIPSSEEFSYNEDIYEMNTEIPSRKNIFNNLCYLAGIFILGAMCLFLAGKQYLQKFQPPTGIPVEESIVSVSDEGTPSISDEQLQELYEEYHQSIEQLIRDLENDFNEYSEKQISKETFLKKHPELKRIQVVPQSDDEQLVTPTPKKRWYKIKEK